MAMTSADNIAAMMDGDNDEDSLVRPESVSAIEAISRSEVAMQLDAAHRFPRSVSRFIKEALALVTEDVNVASSCFYSLPRKEDGKEKMLQGPSVRLAEMAAYAWGNLHVGARVLPDGEADRTITAQAVCWDLQKNLRTTVEVSRGIMGRRGRYSDDMIRVTGMAALSIAYRNSVFRVIPRTYINQLLEAAKRVAVGDASTLGQRRGDVVAALGKMGVPKESVFSRLGVSGMNDITLDHLATLIGLGTAIKQGEILADEAFPSLTVAPSPVPEGTPEGKRVKLPTNKGKAPSVATGSPAPANDGPTGIELDLERE